MRYFASAHDFPQSVHRGSKARISGHNYAPFAPSEDIKLIDAGCSSSPPLRSEKPPILPANIWDPLRDRRYVAGELLGRGGFAWCYAFTCPEIRTTFAGKVIPKDGLTLPRHRDKVLHEISIHQDLHHKNIVELISAFEDNTNIYIVLEYCEKQSFLQFLQQRPNGKLSETEASLYFAQILDGVEYLHENGILHRDIKLGNILLKGDQIKLADFGMSIRLPENGEGIPITICGNPENRPNLRWVRCHRFLKLASSSGSRKTLPVGGRTADESSRKAAMSLLSFKKAQPPQYVVQNACDTKVGNVKYGCNTAKLNGASLHSAIVPRNCSQLARADFHCHERWPLPESVALAANASPQSSVAAAGAFRRPFSSAVVNHSSVKSSLSIPSSVVAFSSHNAAANNVNGQNSQQLRIACIDSSFVETYSSDSATALSDLISSEDLAAFVHQQAKPPPPNSTVSANRAPLLFQSLSSVTGTVPGNASLSSETQTRRSVLDTRGRAPLASFSVSSISSSSRLASPLPGVASGDSRGAVCGNANSGLHRLTESRHDNRSRGISLFPSASPFDKREIAHTSRSSLDMCASFDCDLSLSERVRSLYNELLNWITPGIAGVTYSVNSSSLVYVTRWIDYSNRYGFCSQFSNGAVCLAFNDGKRICMSSDKRFYHCYDVFSSCGLRPVHQFEAGESLSSCWGNLASLFDYFCSYMEEKLLQGDLRGTHTSTSSLGPYVHKWHREDNYIAMLLSTGTLQVNVIPDHTKIILSRDSQMQAEAPSFLVTLIDDKRQTTTFPFSAIPDLSRQPGVRRNLDLVRSVLKDFIGLL